MPAPGSAFTLSPVDAADLDDGRVEALDIAARFDVSVETVYRAARRAGIRMSSTRTRARQTECRNAAIAATLARSSPRATAERFGLSRRTVFRAAAAARASSSVTA